MSAPPPAKRKCMAPIIDMNDYGELLFVETILSVLLSPKLPEWCVRQKSQSHTGQNARLSLVLIRFSAYCLLINSPIIYRERGVRNCSAYRSQTRCSWKRDVFRRRNAQVYAVRCLEDSHGNGQILPHSICGIISVVRSAFGFYFYLHAIAPPSKTYCFTFA